MEITPSLADTLERINQLPDEQINALMDIFDALIISKLLGSGVAVPLEEQPTPTGDELN